MITYLALSHLLRQLGAVAPLLVLAAALLAFGCAARGGSAPADLMVDTVKQPPAVPPLSRRPDPAKLRPAGTPPQLHTQGNRLVGPDGRPVRLRGVNIASLEWTDTGENVTRSLAVAIDDWGSNLVRLPLSQDRWFGRAPTQHDGGKQYRAIVDGLVTETARRGAYLLLDLHWSNVGAWGQFIGQHRMPDAGSLRFWQDVARRYADHPAVLFGLYNEPHDIDWEVWRNGGVVEEDVTDDAPEGSPAPSSRTTARYRAVGMQALADAVRAVGAKQNLLVVGGLDWAYDLAGLTEDRELRGGNIVYDTHVYPNKDWKPEFSWEDAFLVPSRTLPVLVGEWGADTRGHLRDDDGFVAKMVQCLRDNPQLSWTAWDLHPSAGPRLIRNWEYEPTDFGQVVKQELKSRDQ